MQTPRRICSIHHVVELAPGVWTLHRMARQSPRSNSEFIEAACPTCLQVAREACPQQYPTFSPDASPLLQPATS